MTENYYTTSEAARVLSVSPDTVLKWVNAGKIDSFRTPGGHSRIPKDAVMSMLPSSGPDSGQPSTDGRTSDFKYCWEFHGINNAMKEECSRCVAYLTRARRCYELRDLPGQFGALRLHCKLDCAECEYFRLVRNQSTTALILTRNRQLTNSLKVHTDNPELSLRFAGSEYECAAVIDRFRPDFVVIDCSLGMSKTREICQHLESDDRIPYTRIILASNTAANKDCHDGSIFGWIRKPFTFEQLKQCVDREHLSAEQQASVS
ncbi:MAG: excisionase family DNA-binding protein [candidate division Zixibacteria bacterium]